MIKNILEIVDITFLQNVQDFFAKTLDIASLIVDSKGPITKPSNFTDFCTNCIRSKKIGRERCNKCYLEWGKTATQKGSPVIYKCHAGLTDFIVPIIIKDQHIASILGGQVLLEPPKEEKFLQLAKELKIDEEECLAKVQQINIVSPEKIEGTIDFLYDVANSISSLLYANLKLAKLGMNYKPSRSFKMEDWFFPKRSRFPIPISEREFEVLKLIVLGKTNTEIAKELCISVHTAKAHVSSILEKFLVEDRVQIAVKAIREGFI